MAAALAFGLVRWPALAPSCERGLWITGGTDAAGHGTAAPGYPPSGVPQGACVSKRDRADTLTSAVARPSGTGLRGGAHAREGHGTNQNGVWYCPTMVGTHPGGRMRAPEARFLVMSPYVSSPPQLKGLVTADSRRVSDNNLLPLRCRLP